jgi:hypothetical protein
MEGKTLLAVRILGRRWRSRCEGLLFMSFLLRPPSGVDDIPNDERMGQLPVNKLTEDPELEQRVSSHTSESGKNGQSHLDIPAGIPESPFDFSQRILVPLRHLVPKYASLALSGDRELEKDGLYGLWEQWWAGKRVKTRVSEVHESQRE